MDILRQNPFYEIPSRKETPNRNKNPYTEHLT